MKIQLEKIISNFKGKKSGFVDSGFVKTCNELITGHMQPVLDESIDYAAEEASEDRRIGGWIRSIFTLTDDQYMRKCGVDAVQYLKFQRHLIFFVAIISIACICIILPINFQGMITIEYLLDNTF